MKLGTIALFTALAGLSLASAAKADDAIGCPRASEGAVIRVSKIKPTGSLAGFQKAFADHAKWYADHGRPDKLLLEPVFTFDRARRALVAIPDQMMTVHYHAGSAAPPHDGDAAWDAYVAEYKANSDVLSETITCLPN